MIDDYCKTKAVAFPLKLDYGEHRDISDKYIAFSFPSHAIMGL